MIPTVTSCNTCRAAFPNTEKLKEHYRGEWHAFNSKRRSSELAPLALKEFAVYVSSKNKNSAGQPARKGSAPGKAAPAKKPAEGPIERPGARAARLASGSNVDVAAESALAPAEPVRNAVVAPDAVAVALSEPPSKMGKPAAKSQELDDEDEEDTWTDASGEEDDEFEEEMDEAALLKRHIAPQISIFDDKVFPDAISCVNYMEQQFGFFIPDIECLTDLSGLLLYLGQKVKLGGICLYCQKQFEPGRPCQNHMISKSHCKITYEEDIDLDEYEDYYGYDLASGGESDDEELEVSAIGELILPNKTIGHRSYAKYYKQNLYKKEDNRPSILAVRREEVARLGLQFGSGVTKMDEKSLMKLSDAAVAGVLAKQRREVLREIKKQQRAEQRFVFRTQKVAEYNSTVDKLRSHQTTTDKIRDYHGMLK